MHLHSKNASQIYLMNTYFEFWCQPCNNQGHLIVMMDILKQYIFRNILILINRSVWLVDEARMQKWSFGRNYCFPDNVKNRFVILNPQNHIFPLFSAKTRLQQPLLIPPSSESLSPSSPALSHSKILTTTILPFISCLHFHQRETPLSLLCRVYLSDSLQKHLRANSNPCSLNCPDTLLQHIVRWKKLKGNWKHLRYNSGTQIQASVSRTPP